MGLFSVNYFVLVLVVHAVEPRRPYLSRSFDKVDSLSTEIFAQIFNTSLPYLVDVQKGILLIRNHYLLPYSLQFLKTTLHANRRRKPWNTSI